MPTKRNLTCIRVGVVYRRSTQSVKGGGGRTKVNVKREHMYTLCEGPEKPQFTFRGVVPFNVGDKILAKTSDWSKQDIWCYPDYEIVRWLRGGPEAQAFVVEE